MSRTTQHNVTSIRDAPNVVFWLRNNFERKNTIPWTVYVYSKIQRHYLPGKDLVTQHTLNPFAVEEHPLAHQVQNRSTLHLLFKK